MFIFIKNMVCVRCVMAVKSVLETNNISYLQVETGRAELETELSADQYKELQKGLAYYELELIDNKRQILVERIKNLIVEMIYFPNGDPVMKFSVMLSEALGYDYTYLSNIFSELEGSTIEKFYILMRIRRVKELILHEKKSIKEIAYLLNYSSVAHLCFQFKKITGQRPSEFKKISQSPHYSWNIDG